MLTGTQLQEQHINDITDLSREVPGLSFSNEGDSGLSKIELRGISSDAGSPTVGLYLDEVPITMRNLLNTGATEPQFFDLDRIEVLRGPQGTLYGASSMGGTIRFISKQPDLDDYGGNIYSELSGTKHGGINYEESGVVNMPIVKGMSALRLGFDYVDNSGYIDQLSPTGQVADTDINDESTGVLRATLKARLNDDLTITPALFFQRMRVNVMTCNHRRSASQSSPLSARIDCNGSRHRGYSGGSINSIFGRLPRAIAARFSVSSDTATFSGSSTRSSCERLVCIACARSTLPRLPAFRASSNCQASTRLTAPP